MDTHEYLVQKFSKALSVVPLIEDYLKRTGINNLEVGETDVKHLIREIYSDFKNFKISTDEMSDLFGKFSILINDCNIRQTNVALDLELYSEIEWDLRNDLNAAFRIMEKLSNEYSV